MGKKMILGYTRSGRPVLLPTQEAPDTSDVDAYRRTRARFDGWSSGDHKDASRILMEHGERARDPKVGPRCTRWSSVHWDLGRRPRG